MTDIIWRKSDIFLEIFYGEFLWVVQTYRKIQNTDKLLEKILFFTNFFQFCFELTKEP